MLLTLGLQLWPGASEALRFVRASYEQGAHWQLITAQWVHLSLWHAVANALALGLIVLASRAWVIWPLQLAALGGGYAGVALVLALDANCSYYAGASGALHGLLAGNAAAMLWACRVPGWPGPCPVLPADSSPSQVCAPFAPGAVLPGHGADGADAADQAVASALRRRRLIAAAVLGAMAVKLWLQAGGVAQASRAGWGFPVYHPAHVAGALGGIALVSLLCAARAARAAQAQAQRGQ